jgi:hypothetical protein
VVILFSQEEVSASEDFTNMLRLQVLQLMGEEFRNDQLEMLCLDFQPQQPHKQASDGVQIVNV